MNHPRPQPTNTPRRIYLASSWRNPNQPELVAFLRSHGHFVYDFRNPTDGDKGFAWSAIDPEWKAWNANAYRVALEHVVAVHGYDADFAGMEWADTCILLQPCGRSAHLEAGYMAGQGKAVYARLADGEEPELMYRLMFEAVGALAVFDHELLWLLDAKRRKQPLVRHPAAERRKLIEAKSAEIDAYARQKTEEAVASADRGVMDARTGP
jgi:hypothetical protein